MANPKELQEAAEAIRDVRQLPAVQRHKQLEGLLQQAEEWARREYRRSVKRLATRTSAFGQAQVDNVG